VKRGDVGEKDEPKRLHGTNQCVAIFYAEASQQFNEMLTGRCAAQP